jgi:hypothetical protein
MLVARGKCPGCSQALRILKEPPVKVQCPRCGTRFVLGAAALTPATNGPPGQLPPVPLSLDDGPCEVPVSDDRPARAGLVLVGLVLLLLGGGGALAAYLVLSEDRNDPLALRAVEPTQPATQPAEPTRPAPSDPPRPTPPSEPGLPFRVEPPRRPIEPAKPVRPTPVAHVNDELQRKIDEAIDKGVRWLKVHGVTDGGAHQNRLGTWALTGLTLLECGVPPDDPAVQKVLERVRNDARKQKQTYDLSLCIMFLDRYGDSGDRELIQMLALRLIAGQNRAGGWTYECPVLSPDTERQLLLVLEDLPPLPGQIRPGGPGRQTDPKAPAAPPQTNPPAKPGQQSSGTQPGEKPGGGAQKPAAVNPPPAKPAKKPPVKPNKPGKPLPALPPDLNDLPVARFEPGQKLEFRNLRDDNSNTQFAILALWIARKHGIPAERSLAMIEARFRQSQQKDGTWGYHTAMTRPLRPDSMTCAGLVGLAVGRGVVQPEDAARLELTRDPAVEQALRHLGTVIGKPSEKRRVHPLGADSLGDLYFLWSLERVAVIYDLRTIDGKDWYTWGAEAILKNQSDDGSWREQWAGTPDTCFALLFLKRANVAQDLTETLRQFQTTTPK